MGVTGDGTESADGRWLTYDELATVRGIKRIGAVRLAKRQGWRRQPGNDGKARVMVPTEALSPVRGTQRPRPDNDGDPDGDLTGEANGDVTGGVNGEVTGGLTVAVAFERALTAIREAKDAEISTLRDVVDGLRGTIAREEVRAATAERRATEAEAILRAKDAQIAEQRAAADQTRAEAQQALAAATAAEEVAEALRQAEAERKARGRLRRAWDGWRGR